MRRVEKRPHRIGVDMESGFVNDMLSSGAIIVTIVVLFILAVLARTNKSTTSRQCILLEDLRDHHGNMVVPKGTCGTIISAENPDLFDVLFDGYHGCISINPERIAVQK